MAKKARAIADIQAGLILATIDIQAPPKRVFAALTESSDVMKWWGSKADYQTDEWHADVRVGGKWQARGTSHDGHRFAVGGEYLEVDPPNRLVQTWRADWDGNSTTKLIYELAPIADGTRLTLRHEGFAGRKEACEGHAAGWEKVLGWLGGYLVSASDDEFFVAKLIATRPTFPADITPAEAAVMGEHRAYISGHQAQGKVIVFGPVADPKGTYGLAVFRVKNGDELAAIVSGDPAKVKLGFTYDIAPMIQAVLPS